MKFILIGIQYNIKESRYVGLFKTPVINKNIELELPIVEAQFIVDTTPHDKIEMQSDAKGYVYYYF